MVRILGWGVMHLFYTEIGNLEGADLCLEMANKYLNYQNEDVNYFNTVDDLAWTTEICPNTIFFKTAMLLIKMRALNVFFTNYYSLRFTITAFLVCR